jgi:hypothetical protein
VHLKKVYPRVIAKPDFFALQISILSTCPIHPGVIRVKSTVIVDDLESQQRSKGKRQNIVILETIRKELYYNRRGGALVYEGVKSESGAIRVQG